MTVITTTTATTPTAETRARWAAALAAAPTQAEIDTRAAEAAGLLETIRDQAAEWIGDDVDGFTLTAVGSLFGAWRYDDTYDYVHTGRVRYLDEELDDVQVAALRANLRRFAEIAADEHVGRGRNGWTLVHLAPYLVQD
ncbi:hypothetical protein [Streptomyces sp. NPDC049879]|uniref:hypothetical protein n=1 Tax=Streptomyces sp. NPDC049879 TaxID=3365598 RepID=UPI0037A9E17D